MILSTLIFRPKPIQKSVKYLPCWNLAFCHQTYGCGSEELLPSEWYRAAYAKIIRLTRVLKDTKQIDGRLININDNSIITDEFTISHIKTFKLLAKMFIRPISLQCSQKKMNPLVAPLASSALFSEPNEKSSMILTSLTKISDFLNISAQKRSSVRLAACAQVAQHHIWRGALMEVLGDLKYEMESSVYPSMSFRMGEQILSSCIKFLTDVKDPSGSASPSWMRPTPLRKVEKPPPSRSWEELLGMLNDLTNVLRQDQKLAYHVSKIELMKEGLYQIKDILVERDIAHKELRRQDSLVQKKLTNSLGHSSKCLFILLLYYLFGTVREIEVDVCGRLCSYRGKTYLCIGKILTSFNEESVHSGVMQLNRALVLFQFVWQTAAMDGVLELQGHVWCPGADERSLTYRGNVFYMHGLSCESSLDSFGSKSCKIVLVWMCFSSLRAENYRWSIPEIKDCLKETGFQFVHVWIRQMPNTMDDEDKEEFSVGRDVKYEELASFPQQDAWNAYIVGVKVKMVFPMLSSFTKLGLQLIS